MRRTIYKTESVNLESLLEILSTKEKKEIPYSNEREKCICDTQETFDTREAQEFENRFRRPSSFARTVYFSRFLILRPLAL